MHKRVRTQADLRPLAYVLQDGVQMDPLFDGRHSALPAVHVLMAHELLFGLLLSGIALAFPRLCSGLMMRFRVMRRFFDRAPSEGHSNRKGGEGGGSGLTLHPPTLIVQGGE